MAKGVVHVGKDKSLSLLIALEILREGWDEEFYRKKNVNPTNNYDWSRHDLNFEVVDGRVMPLGSQDMSLYERYQNLLKEVNFKEYKAGASNKQNTYVELILSGSTDRMQQIAFSNQEVNYERNPETWHNWHVHREKAIEEWALDAYKFVCQRYGKESVIGFEVHLDETEPHAHVNIVPIAVKNQRGNVGGFIKVDADGNPMTYTKGKHVGEVIKLSKGKYDALSEEKKKEYRPALRGTVRTISFAEHFGSTRGERKKKMSELHDEYYRHVGAKWGLDRGDVWDDLPEEERRKRRRRTKEEAYQEKKAREAAEKAKAEAKKAMEDRNAVEYDLAEKKADYEKMAKASLYDNLFHSGLSPKVRQAFMEKDKEHKEELRDATMATYSDGSPIKGKDGKQMTWKKFAEHLLNRLDDEKTRNEAEKEVAVAQAQSAAKVDYDEKLRKHMQKQAETFENKIEMLKNEHKKELLAFNPDGTPINDKKGRQVTKDEFIKHLKKKVYLYTCNCDSYEKKIEQTKELIMNMIHPNLKKIIEGILGLLKDGVTDFFNELKNILVVVLDTKKTIEGRKKYVNDAFNFTKIIASIDGIKYKNENLMLLRDDAMRIADGTWDNYHKQQKERQKLEQFYQSSENLEQESATPQKRGRR